MCQRRPHPVLGIEPCVQTYHSQRQSKPITSRYKKYVLRKQYRHNYFKLNFPKSVRLNLVKRNKSCDRRSHKYNQSKNNNIYQVDYVRYQHLVHEMVLYRLAMANCKIRFTHLVHDIFYLNANLNKYI